MASGKTTVGQKLADRLECHFCNLDGLIAADAGCDIETIFAREGEDGFRRREAAAMQQLAKREAMVVATGGGAVLDEGNRNRMKEGTVIYLKVDSNLRCERAGAGHGRPLLNRGKIKETIARLDKVRTPLYQAVADFEVDNNGAVDETVEKIMRLIGEQNENLVG